MTWVGEYNTYERSIGPRRPVVTHFFYGDTQAEVFGVVRAHMQSDKFFDGCTNKGRFGNIECWTEYRIYERPAQQIPRSSRR